MNAKEQETVNQLLNLARELREENRMFRNDITILVNELSSKTDKKFVPITLEQDILQIAQSSINEAIKANLTGYSSPLTLLVKSVVEEHSTQLREIISSSFNSVISKDDFKQSIVSAFAHKVSRSIISNNDGLFDKVANELKQDAIFKSKMSLAVANVVEECLKEKSN